MTSDDRMTDEQIEEEAREVAEQVLGITGDLANLYLQGEYYAAKNVQCSGRSTDSDHRFGAALAQALGSTDLVEDPVHEAIFSSLLMATADAYRTLNNCIEEARHVEMRCRRVS